jgi:hypothetical protein
MKGRCFRPRRMQSIIEHKEVLSLLLLLIGTFFAYEEERLPDQFL